MKQVLITFDDITSVENLLCAWKEFVRGKRGKRDVQEFGLRLMDNILTLHHDLISRRYRHGGYEAFNISDPKPRNIHKASVRDRLVHHALYRALYPHFDRRFIADSYSCRLGKGTHRAMERFKRFTYAASRNNTRTCWVLKCDVKKFFASVDHRILMEILKKHITDAGVLWLLGRVIESFETKPGVGLPLGNLTSQLLVNVYMNEFDRFVKHELKAKHYIRYADDFIVLSHSRDELLRLVRYIALFLGVKMKLTLHLNLPAPRTSRQAGKVSITTLSSGVDFLGWVHFPDYRVLRTTTKRRMLKRTKKNPVPETLVSYLGMLSHGNTYTLARQMLQ